MSLRRRWPHIVLGLMMALYLAYFSWFTLRAYDVFVYQAYDLGIYDQAVWNTAHGHPFRSTLEGPYDSLLGDHFEPILLPMALIYLLWDSPKALLFIQAAGLALGALPVYWLARDRLRSTFSTSCYLPVSTCSTRRCSRPTFLSSIPARWPSLSCCTWFASCESDSSSSTLSSWP
jgi:uncharacterized membrane protein